MKCPDKLQRTGGSESRFIDYKTHCSLKRCYTPSAPQLPIAILHHNALGMVLTYLKYNILLYILKNEFKLLKF